MKRGEFGCGENVRRTGGDLIRERGIEVEKCCVKGVDLKMGVLSVTS